MSSSNKKGPNSGFSLLELLIAMGITITLMTAASTLLANAIRIRSRENQKSDALADAQRALNIMSREIANAGFNLNNNGIVSADSGQHAIRIRSNLNGYTNEATASQVIDKGEDIRYYVNQADNTKYLVRQDEYGNGSTVLANRIDNMTIHYYDQKVDYTVPQGGDDISCLTTEVAKENAKYIVIAVAVTLDQVGTPGSPGYHAAYSVVLCSDVALRNSGLWSY